MTRYFQEEYLKRINVQDTIGLFPTAFGKSLHFTIALNAPGLEKAIERSKTFAAKAAADKLNETVVKEGMAFLEQTPRQESERKLRKKYLEFIDGKISSTDLVAAHDANMAELKISKDAAEEFADNILRVMRFTRDFYVKPVKFDEMAVHAVKGLYRWADEKIPAEMKTRLDQFKSVEENDIKDLLVDARISLGNRDAIRNEKGLDRTLKYMLTNLRSAYRLVQCRRTGRTRTQHEGLHRSGHPDTQGFPA